jgi:hypothetical protein
MRIVVTAEVPVIVFASYGENFVSKHIHLREVIVEWEGATSSRQHAWITSGGARCQPKRIRVRVEDKHVVIVLVVPPAIPFHVSDIRHINIATRPAANTLAALAAHTGYAPVARSHRAVDVIDLLVLVAADQYDVPIFEATFRGVGLEVARCHR